MSTGPSIGRGICCICATCRRATGGFTEFVPLPFVPMEAPIYLKGRARRGPTFREAVLMHAVARLALHPLIPNIQTSWVKMGPEGAAACLDAGANDLGGTLMNESISRAAGAQHGQELPPDAMEALIRSLGRAPRQRTTLYRPGRRGPPRRLVRRRRSSRRSSLTPPRKRRAAVACSSSAVVERPGARAGRIAAGAGRPRGRAGWSMSMAMPGARDGSVGSMPQRRAAARCGK